MPLFSSAPPSHSGSSSGNRAGSFVVRLGFAGLLFFLIKGLLWLVVPALLLSMGIQCSP